MLAVTCDQFHNHAIIVTTAKDKVNEYPFSLPYLPPKLGGARAPQKSHCTPGNHHASHF